MLLCRFVLLFRLAVISWLFPLWLSLLFFGRGLVWLILACGSWLIVGRGVLLLLFLLFLVATVAFFIAIESCQTFLLYQVYGFLWGNVAQVLGQIVGFDTTFVQCYDFESSFATDDDGVDRIAFICGISYLVAQDVGFQVEVGGILCFQRNFFGWQPFLCFYLAVGFIVQATF